MRTRTAVTFGTVIVAALIGLLLVGQAPGHAQQDGVSEADMWVPLWEVSYGGFRKLIDIASASSSEAWGIDSNVLASPSGPRGQTLYVHRTGDWWRVVQVENGPHILAIDMTAPDEGFAVGERGAIQHFGGWRWQSVRSPTVHKLADVAMVSGDEGWAVGDRGTILEWDGSDWEQVEVPEQIRVFLISAVAAPESGEAWATSTGGQILHYEGDDWSVFPAPEMVGLTDIAFDASGRGMAVGRHALEYSGGSWREIDGPGPTMTSVAWHSGVAYASADGQLWQHSDGEWGLVAMPETPAGVQSLEFRKVSEAFDGVWGMSTDDGAVLHMSGGPAAYVRPAVRGLMAIDMITTTFGWAGGAAVTAGLVGSLDGAWSTEIAMPAGSEVRGIDLVSETDGWAVGRLVREVAEARMWRWDGTQWAEWPIEKTWELSNIDMIASDDGFANGGNVIARWDGEEWRQRADVPPAAMPGGLSMLKGGENPTGWFGGYGRIMRLADGEWSQELLSDTGLVFDIEVPDQREGWATTGSALFRFDGETWSEAEIAVAPSTLILDIDAADIGNAWLVTDDHSLYHWNGTDWARHDLSPLGVGFKTLRISAIRIEPSTLATEVWLAGENPSIGLYRIVTPVGVIQMPAVLKGGTFRP